MPAIAAIEVGSGRVLYTTGDRSLLEALLGGDHAGRPRITDPTGRILAARELPRRAAVEGVAYAPRELRVWHEGIATDVVATVARPRTVDGREEAISLLTVTPAVERADATRERFVTIATHELRSPIASLQIDLERLKRRIGRGDALDPADLARDLERPLRQVTRLTLLIQNLLDVTRMQTDAFALARERGDLCAIVSEVVEPLVGQAAAAGCELIMSPCEPIVGLWDRVRVEQILHNLVSNALKYGGGGKPIRVGVERRGRVARLTVRDEGPGVAPEERERIFEPFVRGRGRDDAVATHSLGLGLYIVREIVAAYGGSVTVKGPAGGGATFEVELLVVRDDREEKGPNGEDGEEREEREEDDEAEVQRAAGS